MFFNPIFFKKPKSTDNWASKSVLGERVFLNRDKVKIPAHHQTAAKILNLVSSAGIIFAIYGIMKLALWPTISGIALTYLGKSWYLDRMVWLYEEMGNTPEYRKWLY